MIIMLEKKMKENKSMWQHKQKINSSTAVEPIEKEQPER